MRALRPLRSLPRRVALAAALAAFPLGVARAAVPSVRAHAAHVRVTPEHASGEPEGCDKATIGNIR